LAKSNAGGLLIFCFPGLIQLKAGPLDYIQNAIRIVQNSMIGKTNNGASIRFQVLRTFCILQFLIVMIWTIYFDDQVQFGAVKVDDEMSNRMLSSELETSDFPVTYQIPEFFFCRSMVFPQMATVGNLYGSVSKRMIS